MRITAKSKNKLANAMIIIVALSVCMSMEIFVVAPETSAVVNVKKLNKKLDNSYKKFVKKHSLENVGIAISYKHKYLTKYKVKIKKKNPKYDKVKAPKEAVYIYKTKIKTKTKYKYKIKTFGKYQTMNANSTIKIPIAIMALNKKWNDDTKYYVRKAIIYSDNDAANKLWYISGYQNIIEFLRKYNSKASNNDSRWGLINWSLSAQVKFLRKMSKSKKKQIKYVKKANAKNDRVSKLCPWRAKNKKHESLSQGRMVSRRKV
jgi:hypothetical protein